MSSHSHSHRSPVGIVLLAAFAVLCSIATFAAGQEPPAPKWEFYGGYSFFHPGADVHGVLPLGLLPVTSRLEANPRGIGAGITYDFNRWFGLTLDSSTLWNSGETGTDRVDDTALSNLSLGPKITFRHAHFSPFLEVLVGDHRLMPDAFHDIQKLGVMAGGGLDVNLTRHVALRLLRADFVYSDYRYGPSTTTPATEIRGVRLQSGLVIMFGGEPAIPVAASCSLRPNEVMAGEPVSATATASNFNPKHSLAYGWSSTGGKISSRDADASIDTNGLAGGSYTVTARVSDPKRQRSGEAICNSTFAVREPPQESANHVLFGESFDGGDRRILGHRLQLHQPGQRPDCGGWLERERGQPLGQRQHGRSRDVGRCRGPHHSECDLQRFARTEYSGHRAGHGRESSSGFA